MTAPHPRPLLTPRKDLAARYDVVVLGSGCAGMTSALVAARTDRSVAVLEKASQLGGTTAAGGGVMWAPNNPLLHEAGLADSPADAASYLRAATRGRLTAEEIDWYVQTSAAAVQFLAEETLVDYAPLGRPDYHSHLPGATSAGRGLDHREFDPKRIPGLAEALRPPTYLPLLTMDERDQLHGAAPDPRLLDDRRTRGVRTMGGALAGALLASAWDAGITIAADAPATNIRPRVDGGWLVEVAHERKIEARYVVIATGGFEWSRELTETFLRFPVTPISAPSNEGDGLKLGLSVGASVAETKDIWGVPVITARGQEYDGRLGGRMGNVEATLPGSIVVNRYGERFVNEALNYHDFSRVFANVDPATATFANIPAHLVVDATYASRYAIAGHAPFTAPEDAPDWLASAPTVRELAERISVDPDGLEATVESFNERANVGEDPVFGRGSTPQDRHLGDPTVTPNPCLAPLEAGPFYAVELHPGVLGTAGGLNTDEHGRVVDWSGWAIDGLYAAGNCSATVFKDAYPGGGATIGSAITRAYAVGSHIAAR